MLTLKNLSAKTWFVLVIVFLIPLIVWSSSRNPPLARTGAPGEGTCASCHSGGFGGGTVAIASSSGNTYTPGVTQHLTVTISDGNASAWGYEMTAVQASATSTGAGSFVATDTNSSVRASGTKSYAAQLNDFAGTTGSHSYAVDWTPPATNVGNVTLYAAGVGADNSGDTSGDSVYTTNLSLTPASSGSPSLSLSPTTLNFSYQIGGTAPATQNVSVSSSGTALSYTVGTSATWLTATPTSGTTPGTVGVGINTSGLTAGTYNGTVTVTASGASNSPQTVAVALTVTSSTPSLTLSPTTLTYSYQIGGTAPAAQSVSVSSSGSALSYTVTTSATWLTASPASGATPGTISVGINTSGLTAGTYNGTVTVTASGASNSPRTVAATLTVTNAAAPNLTLSPGTLSYAYQIGGTAPAAQNVSVGSTGAALSYTVSSSASWLTASPASGTTPGTVSVGINTSGLTAGTYNGTVTVTAASAGNSPQSVAVTLTVTNAAAPNLTLSPGTLSFAYQIGGTAPSAQNVSVGSTGAALSYTVGTSASWLTASPASGTTPGTVSVGINTSGLTAGTYNGTVTVAASSAGNSPQQVRVTLVVTAPGLPNLVLSPSALTFGYVTGGSTPAAQSVSVSSSGSALSYTVTTSAAWLSATPASGSTPGTLSVSVNPSGLAVGTYNGTVTITSAGAANSPATVSVTFNVLASTPRVRLSPGAFTFSYVVGGAAPGAQNLSVTSGGVPIGFTVSTTPSWLSANPTSGTTGSSVSLSVNPTGLAAGSYNGSVTITAPGASNSPQTVGVTLNVSPQPNLTLTPATLTFSSLVGGTAPATQAVSVSSSGSSLSYTASTSAAWLTVSPASGTTPGTLNVGVNPSGLAAGTYTGTVTVTASSAANSPQRVNVTYTVTAGTPSLSLSPATLAFSYQSGGFLPSSKSVAVSSNGAALNYSVTTSAAWLSATPASGATPGSLTVNVNPSSLAAGTYTGTVTVTSSGAGNSPQQVSVTLTVTPAVPNLRLSPGAFTFSYKSGGTVPGSQALTVNSTGSALSYTVSSVGSWLSVSPASGTTTGTVNLSVNPAGLGVGSYSGSVTVTSSGAGNSPQTVGVTLIITAAAPVLQASARTLTLQPVSAAQTSAPLSKSLVVTSTAEPVQFTAEALGGSWLSVSPSGGTTNGEVTVTAAPQGLAKGKYTGQVRLSAPGLGSIQVPVTFTVAEDAAGAAGPIRTSTYIHDPANTGAVAADWVHGAGVPGTDPEDRTNQGLLLVNSAGVASKARAGVILQNVEGLTLTALGFDIREGSQCTLKGPRFIVVTADDVVHTLGGCVFANAQPVPAKGWRRFRFDPAKAVPAIAQDATVKSIALVLDDGPDADGGLVVLDNINVNGNFVGHE